jgi:enoyl-CoA hydratase/carnithine racemase
VYRHLLVERSEDRHVVIVTLNRPEQMNAMNTAMGEDLLAWLPTATPGPWCSRGLVSARSVPAVI